MATRHGDRKGRHYHTRKPCKKRNIVVATLAVAMPHPNCLMPHPNLTAFDSKFILEAQ